MAKEKLPATFITLGVFNASFGLAQIQGALKRGEPYDAAKLLVELTNLGETIQRCGVIVVKQIEKDAEARVALREAHPPKGGLDERLRTRGKKQTGKKRKKR